MHHHFGVSTIKSSNSGKIVASADYNKAIVLWDSTTKEVISEAFVFHITRVYSLSWSSDDSLLVSTALDNSAIVWDVLAKKRVRTFAVIDADISLTSSFYINDESFVVGGHNCSPRVISIK
jgi:WD40 repeat protein